MGCRFHPQLTIMIPSMAFEVESNSILASIIAIHGRKFQNRGMSLGFILCSMIVFVVHFTLHLGDPIWGNLEAQGREGV
jgi:hypothetical protein